MLKPEIRCLNMGCFKNSMEKEYRNAYFDFYYCKIQKLQDDPFVFFHLLSEFACRQ